MAAATTNSFYKNPRLSTIAYAVGLLLFFLPFLEIKCNGASVGQLSGKDLVFGSAPAMGKDMKEFGKSFGDDKSMRTNAKNDLQGKVYVVAILAFILGLTGLVFSFEAVRNYTATLVAGIAGALALIVLIIQVKGDINTQMKTEATDNNPFSDQFSGMLKVSVDITAWFILCLLSYVAAAFFSYKQKTLIAAEILPPPGAPQVDINNPGTQSDFPSAPTGYKDLG